MLYEKGFLFKEKKLRDAVSKSYYAFLEAARAALLTRGKTAKTHAGTLTLFEMEFGKTKIIPSRFIIFYRQILKDRMEADYEMLREFSKEEADKSIKMAEEFVSFIEKNLIFKKITIPIFRRSKKKNYCKIN